MQPRGPGDPGQRNEDAPRESGSGRSLEDTASAPEFRVEDRRHWNQASEDAAEGPRPDSEPRKPSLIDEYRARAEAAEARLQEYIEAFKQHQREQDEFRSRLARDVDRRVELKFAGLVRDLLETVDTLDLAVAHGAGLPEAAPVTHGVQLARDRFLAMLTRHGIERIDPAGAPFDPEQAEAVRVDEVQAGQDGRVTETLQPGFRLGQHVVRPARVAVGRRGGSGST
jgi:molecular chaperone GrpE